MLFGLKNAPALFQHLMQHILMVLNPTDGPDFVWMMSLCFQVTTWNLIVLQWFASAGLKLKLKVSSYLPILGPPPNPWEYFLINIFKSN